MSFQMYLVIGNKTASVTFVPVKLKIIQNKTSEDNAAHAV